MGKVHIGQVDIDVYKWDIFREWKAKTGYSYERSIYFDSEEIRTQISKSIIGKETRWYNQMGVRLPSYCEIALTNLDNDAGHEELENYKKRKLLGKNRT
jgi:hypothetical protein